MAQPLAAASLNNSNDISLINYHVFRMIRLAFNSCVFSHLIIFFCFLPIFVWFQNDKIAQLLAAANVKISDNFGGLFAKASAGLDLKELVSTISTSIGSGAYTHRNVIKSTWNQIVFTIFRLIWIEINRKMVNTIWFQVDLIRFLCEIITVCSNYHGEDWP